MSNPGVITLASMREVGPNMERLDIEDNIGEAIHIHWNSLRLDMTIDSFLAFSDELIGCADSLALTNDFSRDNFDPQFLFRMGPLVSQIEAIEIHERKLNDLRCLVNIKVPKLGLFKLPKPVMRTPAYQYLQGLSDTFLTYDQDSYPGLDNKTRLADLAESIQKHGYPREGRHIILFGDQNYIRDGQHRAACLAASGGVNQTIPVMVLRFSGHGWKLYPYKSLVISTMRKFTRAIIRLTRRFLWKVRTITG